MNKKQTETAKKFQPKVKRTRGVKFWIGTVVYTFIFLKTIQLSRYMISFSYSIPTEQMKTNMLSFNIKDMKSLKPEVIQKYLDELEKMKNDRKKK
jgi:hypothetical protein